jgi:hypothetical protein
LVHNSSFKGFVRLTIAPVLRPVIRDLGCEMEDPQAAGVLILLALIGLILILAVDVSNSK